jgi:general stress protein 26
MSAMTHSCTDAFLMPATRREREDGAPQGECMPDRKQHEVLWDLISETRFCMLAHRHADGSLHSHPLTTMNRELGEDGALYFFVSRSTELGQRLAQDGNVNLSYGNVDKDTWVSVTGTAGVLEDLQKKKELFGPMAKAWFPGGPEDPDLELVQVRVSEAEYWNVKENKLLQMLKMGKAAITGTRPSGMGEHKQVQFD